MTIMKSNNPNILAIEKINGSHKIVGIMNMSGDMQEFIMEENIFNFK